MKRREFFKFLSLVSGAPIIAKIPNLEAAPKVLQELHQEAEELGLKTINSSVREPSIELEEATEIYVNGYPIEGVYETSIETESTYLNNDIYKNILPIPVINDICLYFSSCTSGNPNKAHNLLMESHRLMKPLKFKVKINNSRFVFEAYVMSSRISQSTYYLTELDVSAKITGPVVQHGN